MANPALVTSYPPDLDQLRPELHRYCARLTGSAVDGEDLVQETLLEALTSVPEPSRLRAWAFRTAHNRAIDRWRSYESRMRESADALVVTPDPTPAADDVLAQQEAVRTALSRFVALPPLQRSCVILKDVLDQTLDEIAALLETTVPAVQAALHRGRRALREQVDVEAPPMSPVLARYAALFGARNWDDIRTMLADDVRLDVIDRGRKLGRRDVGNYFGNYERLHDWSVEPRVIDNQQVLAVSRNGSLAHLIAITIDGERVTAIRDYFHVPYLVNEARIT